LSYDDFHFFYSSISSCSNNRNDKNVLKVIEAKIVSLISKKPFIVNVWTSF